MADEDLGLRPLEAATQTEDSDLGLRPLDETAGMRPVGSEATSAHPYLAAAARVVPALVGGINVMGGVVTHKAVAEAHGMHFEAPKV